MATAAQLVARLRKLCLAIERAGEKISHGEPTWFAGPKGKVFAMFDNHHHGAPHISVWLPTPPELQRELVASDPDRYFVPPYVCSKGWTGVVLDTSPDWKALEALIREAHANIAKPPALRRRSS